MTEIAGGASFWTDVLRVPWPQARAAARQRLDASGATEIDALLTLRPLDQREEWLTDVLRRQVPLAAHAAAALGDRCPAEIRERVADGFARWVAEMPEGLADQALEDLPSGAFRRSLCLALLSHLRATPAGEDDERTKFAQPLADALAALEPREALPDLRAALADEDPLVRGFVALVLGSLHLELEALLRLHDGDPDENVRFRARLALGLTKRAEALPPLLSALKDPDDEGGAASALALHGSKEAAVALVEAIRDDPGVQLELQLTGEGAPDLSAARSEELVARLIKQLKSRSEDKRLTAVTLLHVLRADSAIPDLVACLADKSDLVPNAAVEALAAMKAVSAVPDLVRCLKSRDFTLARDAATALGAVGATDAVAELGTVLRRAKDEQVRAAAAEALGRLGSAAAIPALVGALADLEPGVRAAAAKALGRLGATEASGALARSLGDSTPAVVGEAARALGRLAGPQIASRLARLVQGAARGEAHRDGALEGLWALADRLTAPTDEREGAARPAPLLDRLLDAPWATAVKDGLEHMRTLAPEAQARFVEALLHYERDGVRGWTTGVLARQVPLAFRLSAACGGRLETLQAELIERMLEWVVGQPTVVTAAPLRSLQDLPAPVCVGLARSLVRELAESGESPRRDKVFDALRALRPRSEERALLELATGKKRGIRRLAVGILAALSTPAADDALRAAATDRDHFVRLIATDALTDGTRGDGLDVLRRSLADPSTDVRLQAVQRLGRIAGEEATGLLRAALADRKKDVRAAAAARLACRGDEDGLRTFLGILASDETDEEDPVEATTVFEGIDDSAGILAGALEQAKQGEGWLSDVAQSYLDGLAEAQRAPAASASVDAASTEPVAALVAKAEGRSWEAEGALAALWGAIERGLPLDASG